MTSEQESEERLNRSRSWLFPLLMAFLIQTATLAFFVGSAWRQIAVNTERLDNIEHNGSPAIGVLKQQMADLKELLQEHMRQSHDGGK